MYVIYAMDIEGLKVCSIFSDQHAGYLASHACGLHSTWLGARSMRILVLIWK